MSEPTVAPEPARERLTGLLPALPGLLVIAGGLALAPVRGGFAPEYWYPAALFALVLLVVVLAAARPRLAAVGRPAMWAIGSLALLVALSFLSITWAVTPADAWDGANRTLLYLLAFAVVVLCPWTPARTRAALGLVVAGIGVLALVAVLRDEPSQYLGGRLSWPMGYTNATANLWLIGLFPAVALAVDRGLHWALRGGALGVATLLLTISLLSQSRGAAIATIATAIVLVAIVPRRWPAIAALGTAALAVVVSWDRLLAVREATSVADLLSRVSDARTAILLTALVAALLGAAAAFGGRRATGEEGLPALRRTGDRALGGAAVVAVVAGVIALVLSPGWVDRRWDDFRTGGYEEVESGENRFTGALGSNRYDFYRVALDEFERRPLVGTGADNFAVAYLRERRSPESPRYPHSLLFQFLAGLGAVGTALFAAFLVAAIAAFRRGRRAVDAGGRVAAAGAMAGGAAWLIHGLVDWLWLFPPLGLLAFALLGLAARGGQPDDDSEGGAVLVPTPSRAWTLPARAAAVAVTLTLALSLALPGISARFTAAALDDTQITGHDLDRLRRAADFQPLAARPLLALAVVARRAGDDTRAREALDDAVKREPDNWFAWFELGIAQANGNERTAALVSLGRASRLNPTQPAIAAVRKEVGAGRTIDAEAAEAQLSEEIRVREQVVDTPQE